MTAQSMAHVPKAMKLAGIQDTHQIPWAWSRCGRREPGKAYEFQGPVSRQVRASRSLNRTMVACAHVKRAYTSPTQKDQADRRILRSSSSYFGAGSGNVEGGRKPFKPLQTERSAWVVQASMILGRLGSAWSGLEVKVGKRPCHVRDMFFPSPCGSFLCHDGPELIHR